MTKGSEFIGFTQHLSLEPIITRICCPLLSQSGAKARYPSVRTAPSSPIYTLGSGLRYRDGDEELLDLGSSETVSHGLPRWLVQHSLCVRPHWMTLSVTLPSSFISPGATVELSGF